MTDVFFWGIIQISEKKMIRLASMNYCEAVREICETSLGYETEIETVEEMMKTIINDSHYYIAVFENDSDHSVKGYIQAERYDSVYVGKGWI